jgi:hypothetical protein
MLFTNEKCRIWLITQIFVLLFFLNTQNCIDFTPNGLDFTQTCVISTQICVDLHSHTIFVKYIIQKAHRILLMERRDRHFCLIGRRWFFSYKAIETIEIKVFFSSLIKLSMKFGSKISKITFILWLFLCRLILSCRVINV